MLKRILLFGITIHLVILNVSIILYITGLKTYLTTYSIAFFNVAIACVIWGTSFAWIALKMSIFMTKRTFDIKIIMPRHASPEELHLVNLVHELAKLAKLSHPPKVGIYHSPELNSFSVGSTQNKALLAVSSSLLLNMKTEELESVLAHEISHIKNGDMVTMILLQGIISAFNIFFAGLIAKVLTTFLKYTKVKDRRHIISSLSYSALIVIFDILFTFLAHIFVDAFSRWREYSADRNSARLKGQTNMIKVLERLYCAVDLEDDHTAIFDTLKIARRDSFLKIFSTHPPLKKRIRALMDP